LIINCHHQIPIIHQLSCLYLNYDFSKAKIGVFDTYNNHSVARMSNAVLSVKLL